MSAPGHRSAARWLTPSRVVRMRPRTRIAVLDRWSPGFLFGCDRGVHGQAFALVPGEVVGGDGWNGEVALPGLIGLPGLADVGRRKVTQ
jgi:hypothetical protein